ncbi:hypothetical protein [Sphingomonas swuensis]
MKSEPKPFASLSSGLLARKGAARPAMRPQGFGQMGSNLEDLGWNDMGFEPPKPVLAPIGSEEEASRLRPNPVTGLSPASPVHAVHEELVQRLGNEVEDDEQDETAEPVPADSPPLGEVLAMPVRSEPAEIVEPVQIVEPVAAEPVLVQRKVAAPVSVPAPALPKSRRAVAAKGKAAFTLRLDADRHLKLRLACAVTGTSAQQLVTRALDELLASMPELEAMAQRAPERAHRS